MRTVIKMKTGISVGLLLVSGLLSIHAQVKIGDNPQNIDAFSILELEGTSRALVVTRVSTAQMNGMSPLNGALVYNTDERCIFYYNGSVWTSLCNATGGGGSSITFTTDALANANPNAIDNTIAITQNGDNYNFEVNQITGAHIAPTQSINGSVHIQNASIPPAKLTSGGAAQGNYLQFDGTEWIAVATSPDEVDGIVGNEVTNATAGGALVRNGSGTATAPWTLDVADEGIGTGKLADASVNNAKLDKANIPLSGFGAATANLDMNGNTLINLPDPVNDGDAASKGYVDDQIGVGGTNQNDAEVPLATPTDFNGDGTNEENVQEALIAINNASSDNQTDSQVPLATPTDFNGDGTNEENVQEALTAIAAVGGTNQNDAEVPLATPTDFNGDGTNEENVQEALTAIAAAGGTNQNDAEVPLATPTDFNGDGTNEENVQEALTAIAAAGGTNQNDAEVPLATPTDFNGDGTNEENVQEALIAINNASSDNQTDSQVPLATPTDFNGDGTNEENVQEALIAIAAAGGTNQNDAEVPLATPTDFNGDGTNEENVQEALTAIAAAGGTNQNDVEVPLATPTDFNGDGTNEENVQEALIAINNASSDNQTDSQVPLATPTDFNGDGTNEENVQEALTAIAAAGGTNQNDAEVPLATPTDFNGDGTNEENVQEALTAIAAAGGTNQNDAEVPLATPTDFNGDGTNEENVQEALTAIAAAGGTNQNDAEVPLATPTDFNGDGTNEENVQEALTAIAAAGGTNQNDAEVPLATPTDFNGDGTNEENVQEALTAIAAAGGTNQNDAEVPLATPTDFNGDGTNEENVQEALTAIAAAGGTNQNDAEVPLATPTDFNGDGTNEENVQEALIAIDAASTDDQNDSEVALETFTDFDEDGTDEENVKDALIAIASGTARGTPNAIFFADTDGTPTTTFETFDNTFPASAGGLVWNPSGRNNNFGALYIGLDDALGTGAQSGDVKVQIMENVANGLAYPLMIQNRGAGNASNNRGAVGLLFAAEQVGAFGKGALAYVRQDDFGLGDFVFLQDQNKNNANPDLNDAVMTIKNDGRVIIGTTATEDDALLNVAGDFRLDGALKDSNGEAGTAGQVLSSTATGTDWVDAGGSNLFSADLILGADRTHDLGSNNFVFTNGMIGIGSLPGAPQSQLDVNGQIRTRDGFASTAGSAGEPSYGFYTNDDTDTGMFRAAANQLGFSTGGVEAMRVDASQNVGIGTDAPTAKLHVAGDVRSDGSFLTIANTYPDYVFEKYFTGSSKIDRNYKFNSLDEIEKFIAENHHLPGIKSIKDVQEENGRWNLTDGALKNLEKIEELFLHTIEQEKKIDALQEENENLNEELERLKKDMEQIKELLLKTHE